MPPVEAAEVPPEEADGSAEPEADDAELDELSDVVAVVVVVVELVWVGVEGSEALAAPVVGTVKGGAPEVSAPVVGRATAAGDEPEGGKNAGKQRSECCDRTAHGGRTRGRLGAERLHTPATVRAVVQVLLAQLVAPIAEAQVLDRPRQL